MAAAAAANVGKSRAAGRDVTVLRRPPTEHVALENFSPRSVESHKRTGDHRRRDGPPASNMGRRGVAETEFGAELEAELDDDETDGDRGRAEAPDA